ncbi:gp53-like domain-containing protein, partial [Siccibacter turicensis]
DAANPHTQYPLIANALKEMADAGLVSEVLKNLGLGEAGKRGVGTAVNQIPDMGAFASNLSYSGYQKLPSGLIIQWGLASGGSSYVVTLPVTFPNQALLYLATPHTTQLAGASQVGIANCSELKASQLYIVISRYVQGAMVEYARSCYWLALGY